MSVEREGGRVTLCGVVMVGGVWGGVVIIRVRLSNKIPVLVVLLSNGVAERLVRRREVGGGEGGKKVDKRRGQGGERGERNRKRKEGGREGGREVGR